jgi:protein-L-isoaspartate(D-aspartate) O-methyltransferase
MSLDDHRRFYSRLVTASAGVTDERVISVLAAVPRERFLGPGPWRIFTRLGYVETPSDDPTFVYQDVTIALDAEAQLNNGQPSLHAACLAALAVREGDTVVHVGAGTGYYTAILATLAGPTGRLFAYELHDGLARRAANNLADYPQVELIRRSGSEGPLPPCDVLYVNAGATSPLRVWIEALKPGGRLLFPLTPAQGIGYMLLVTCRDASAFDARFVCGTLFTPCIGARDDDTARRLSETFARGGVQSVRSLRLDTPPDEKSWFAGDGWWLST